MLNQTNNIIGMNKLLLKLIVWACVFVVSISVTTERKLVSNKPPISTEGIVITDAEKIVNLDTTVTTTLKITYVNKGKKTQSNIYFIINDSDFKNVALFTYKDESSPVSTIKKSMFEPYEHFDEKLNATMFYQLCDIALLNSLKVNSKITVTYTMVTTKKLKPIPEEAPMETKPSYDYKDTINIVTIYPIESQVTKFICKQCHIFSHSPTLNSKKIADGIMYIINNDELKPLFNVLSFSIHFSMLKLYTSTVLHRKMYVSEYADVEFVESHTIYNHANKLVSEFSRSKYKAMEPDLKHVVQNIRFHVPKDSFNYYYRDNVGNISGSSLNDARNIRIMDVKPRFPIMGGWNTEFTIKYKLPASKVIKKQGNLIDDDRHFTTNLLGTCQDIVSVDHYILEVILPEYAKFINYNIPNNIDVNVTEYKTFYYMDMYGRVTLRIESQNLIPIHDTKLTFVYQYNSLFLLLKPYYASLGLFIILLTVSVISRSKMFKSNGNIHTSKVDELLELLNDVDILYKHQIDGLKQVLSSVDSYRTDNITKKNFESTISKHQTTLSSEPSDLVALCQYVVDVVPECKPNLEKKMSLLKNETNYINEYIELTRQFKTDVISENEFIKRFGSIDNKIQCNKKAIDNIFD